MFTTENILMKLKQTLVEIDKKIQYPKFIFNQLSCIKGRKK